MRDAVHAKLPLSPDAILLHCSRPEAITQALPIIEGYGVTFAAYANGFESVTSLYPGETVKTLQTRTDLRPNSMPNLHSHGVQWGLGSLVGVVK